MTGITDHLGEIRRRVAAAAARCGRAASEITILAVSKGHPPEAVRGALAAGLRDFGENYLQEALPKIAAVDRDAVWHFIGRIQANKTRDIAARFAWAQTVTSARVAERLAAQRPHYAEPLEVCIQVRPSAGPGDGADSPDRPGCPPADVPALATLIRELPRLRLRGLMVLPHAGLAPADLRAEFASVRELRDRLLGQGFMLDTLSMGMSDDFELAIGEGSTMIRIGTALFGPRP